MIRNQVGRLRSTRFVDKQRMFSTPAISPTDSSSASSVYDSSSVVYGGHNDEVHLTFYHLSSKPKQFSSTKRWLIYACFYYEDNNKYTMYRQQKTLTLNMVNARLTNSRLQTACKKYMQVAGVQSFHKVSDGSLEYIKVTASLSNLTIDAGFPQRWQRYYRKYLLTPCFWWWMDVCSHENALWVSHTWS